MAWWDKYIQQGVGNCLLVVSPDGKSSQDPCGGSWCGPLNALDWLKAAEGYVYKAEQVSTTPEQQAVTQGLRNEVGTLRNSMGVQADYGALVHKAVAISQRANCHWGSTIKDTTPTPTPTPDPNGNGWSWPDIGIPKVGWPWEWQWPTVPGLPGYDLTKYWPIALIVAAYFLMEHPAAKRVRGDE